MLGFARHWWSGNGPMAIWNCIPHLGSVDVRYAGHVMKGKWCKGSRFPPPPLR